MKKQFLAKLLVLVMVLTMVPVTFLAASAAGTNGDYDYSYSIAADTTLEELPEGGVIKVVPQGGVANLPLSDKIVAALPIDDDGNVVLKIDATGAEKVSVTLKTKALTEKSDKDNGIVIEVFGAKVTIPGERLAKAIKDAKADHITIVIVPAAAGAENQLPSVTVYLDWKATAIRGLSVKAL